MHSTIPETGCQSGADPRAWAASAAGRASGEAPGRPQGRGNAKVVDGPALGAYPRAVSDLPSPKRLYRAMKQNSDGKPLCGTRANEFGMRPGVDIAADAEGLVHPETGGLSTTPDDPNLLPPHVRPPSLGGKGKLPVFVLEVRALDEQLSPRRDPRHPRSTRLHRACCDDGADGLADASLCRTRQLAGGAVTGSPLDQYRRLMNELLILREAEGGELPDDLESAYVERLDGLWWKLSEAEQDEYEAELASSEGLSGPETLNLVDCEVDQGGKTTPRKAV